MNSAAGQFVKFAMGGAVGTAAHYATLIVLVELTGAPVVLGAFCGFAVGAVTNYVISRRYVFRTSRSHRAAFPRFAAVASIGAVINTAIVAILFRAGLHYLLAQASATLVVLAMNFLVNKYWTFKE